MSAIVLQFPLRKDPDNPYERANRLEKVKLLSAALRAGGYKAAQVLAFEEEQWHVLRAATPSKRRISISTRYLVYEAMKHEEELRQELSEKEPA